MPKSPSPAAIFARLKAALPRARKISLAKAFAKDRKRFDTMHIGAGDLVFDFSKTCVDAAILKDLAALARASGVEKKRDAMFAGAIVNTTEKRAVLHTALRNLSGKPVITEGRDVMPAILAERAHCAAIARGIRDGALKGASGKAFTDIVNIGIGGSDLGPAMAARALSPFGKPGLNTHFVANVDGADIADTLAGLDPATTLVIVSSKTFTTQETMTNAASARAWMVATMGEAAVALHFAAVSTRVDLVETFGIGRERVFGFWDWVGGRYSLWSSIGLALMIAIGPKNFEDFLRGAQEADMHFCAAPIERNIPMLMALLGVWHRNICGYPAHAVIPYDQRLARFPAYLQQLDMESNGKGVTLDGKPLKRQSGPLIWGEPGTNGQHAFFQLLHQGTTPVPVDFLLAAEPTAADAAHHALLVANCLAQSEALMAGKSLAAARAQLKAAGMSAADIARLAPHKVFPGNRPSCTFLYKRLDPHRLGFLIALYEHKVFVQAAIWGINAFDQWGVELGKELASRLAPIAQDAQASTAGLDASTAGLVAHRRALLKP